MTQANPIGFLVEVDEHQANASAMSKSASERSGYNEGDTIASQPRAKHLAR
jgi:hypothetical protein